MLSNKAKYGLKALIYIAENRERPVQSAEISETNNIPKKFLDAILLEIKNDGILVSKKGRGGGYRLAYPPERISVGRVIRILDGPITALPCVSQVGLRSCHDCANQQPCRVRDFMRDVRDAVVAMLDKRILADLLVESARRPLVVHYDI
jgi:Rrf2 family protein